MKKLLFASLSALSLIASAQTTKAFFLGHSLVNHEMPNMVNKLSVAGGKNFTHNEHIINGSPLKYNWNNPTGAEVNPSSATSYTALNNGGYTHFIVTEAVPLLGNLQWNNTYRYADSLYMFATNNNPNVKFYIYETWHCTATGTSGGCAWDSDDVLTWRLRLTADLPKWEGIADSVNNIHPNSTFVVPAGQALAQLTDSISAGKVPGMTAFTDLFQDDIHLTNTGNYFIACLMYGVIHNESPEGLPNVLGAIWGGTYTNTPTPTQASIFQRIAWRTLCNYVKDGISCAIATSVKTENIFKNISISPNPISGSYIIQSYTETDALLLDYTGKTISALTIQKGENNMNVSNLSNGIYFIKTNNGTSKFVVAK